MIASIFFIRKSPIRLVPQSANYVPLPPRDRHGDLADRAGKLRTKYAKKAEYVGNSAKNDEFSGIG
ncbi:hypothetical protein ACIQW5_03750 [Methylorubrum thiocyanatum]|jgi:hypothetical protein|uniref:hypothetical protein n=1 Tax=Methylorubrum thiocyanatum TaxID=47958 RepID=UPI00383B7997